MNRANSTTLTRAQRWASAHPYRYREYGPIGWTRFRNRGLNGLQTVWIGPLTIFHHPLKSGRRFSVAWRWSEKWGR